MQEVDLNWIAIVLAALVPMVLGMAWYSPLLFARPWMAAVGKARDDLRGPNAGYYALAAVAALVMAYGLARIVEWAEADDLVSGALVGSLAWIGFVATTSAVNSVFAGRPWNLWAIDGGYYLVSLLVMGAILGAWD